jgi:hypothetical protein
VKWPTMTEIFIMIHYVWPGGVFFLSLNYLQCFLVLGFLISFIRNII